MTKSKRQRRDAHFNKPSKPRKRIKPPSAKRDRAPDEPEVEPKKTRIDVSERRRNRKLYNQYVVKASFPGTLSSFLSDEVKDVFREIVDEYVETISQMTVRGSLLANETLSEMFRRGEGICPQTYTFFKKAMAFDPGDNLIMREVIERDFTDCPLIQRSVGDWASFTYASQRYYTTFQNNLWMSFIPRFVSYVQDWSTRFDNDLPFPLASRILGFPSSTSSVLNQQTWVFIQGQRQKLQEPDGFVPEEASSAVLLGMMYDMLYFGYTYGFSGEFSLVPINKVKRHHITIDTTSLYLIMSRIFARLGTRTPLWMQETILMEIGEARELYQDMMWEMMFENFSGLSRGESIHTISTDGVYVNFQRPLQSQTHVNVPAKFEKTDERVISIDPGRTNLVTAFEKRPDGSERYWSLTRRSYYWDIRSSLEMMKRWEQTTLQDIYAEMSVTSIRTADPELGTAYRQVYFDHYTRLWAVKLHKRWAREKLHIYSKKGSIIDRFFMSFMKEDRRKPIILYGGSSTRSGGRGELSVPVKRTLLACKRFYPVIMVNEYLTTKAHSGCGYRMHPVKTERRDLDVQRKQKPIHNSRASVL